MFITPVANYNVNKNHNELNFSGSPKSKLEKLAKKITLQDKVISAMADNQGADIIVIGGKVAEAQKGLMGIADAFDNVIKRIVFIKERVVAPFAIFKDSDGDRRILNLSPDKDIFLRSELFGRVKIEPRETGSFDSYDTLAVGRRVIDFSTPINDNATKTSNIWSTEYDLSEKLDEKICEMNGHSLSTFSSKKIKQKPSTPSAKLSFADVGGLDEQKAILRHEIVNVVKYRNVYKDMPTNHGFVIHGGPGLGKTLLAQATANEIDAHFIKINGQELTSKWVGESEENLRGLFKEAKAKQPSIIVFDEIDTFARKRGDSTDVYGDKMVNQFLTILSDIEKDNDMVFVIGTTNRLDMIDEAVLRSGRLGRHIKVDAYDEKGMGQIFDIHTKKKPIDENLDKSSLIKKMLERKFTGADIMQTASYAHNNAFERSGLLAKMDSNMPVSNEDIASLRITQADFDEAIKIVAEGKKPSNERVRVKGFSQ